MTRSRNRKLVLWGAGILTVVVLAGAFFAVAQATDKATFCVVCHEMAPYYDAWSVGQHAETECVECHVAHGTGNRLLHKFVALGEVYSHFFGNTLFPVGTAKVPDDRCLRCHDETIDPGIPNFDHAVHQAGQACQTCHRTAGHSVTATALAEAGILNPKAVMTVETSAVAVPGQGSANLVGHVTVVCSDCHDMAKTGCDACHLPGHEPRGASTACADCHKPGATWTFAHPDARSDCTACHEAPAGHDSGPCTNCHTPGTKWGFEHADATADCTQCHTAPANHAAGPCGSCHKPGVSWAFAHTSSKDCASCHDAPSKHFGSDCASCHSPKRSWESADFSHPRIRGEHSYRSFSCVTCHPSGYDSYSCKGKGCHDSNNPSDDD